MDVVADVREVGPRSRLALARRAAGFLEREWALVAFCSFVVMRDAYFGRTLLGSDSWFSFVYGRDILRHGLPHHETLTVMGAGRDWIDQQWLGHIALYGLMGLGGPSLVVNVSGLLFSLALVGAIVLARRRGGSAAVLVVVGGISILYATTVVQTEVFSRVFFVILLAVLAAESRKRTRRVWLLLPLVALWANVHGAAVLGAALVSLLGALEVRGALAERAHDRRPLLRGAALVALPLACIFATPYGLGVGRYYRLTMFNSAFREYIDPWKPPPPLSLWGGPFFLLAAIAIAIVVRHRARLTSFEKAALALTMLAALDARRSIPWFATACLLFLAPAVGRGRGPRRAPAVDLRFAAAAFALVISLLAVGQTWAEPQSWYTSYWYDRPVLRVLARYAQAHPRARFWAHDPYGDWVVYEAPALWGKVAFDARWETLSRGQIAALSNFERRAGPRWTAPLYRYDLIAMSRHTANHLPRALTRDPRLRVVYADTHALVFRPIGTRAGERR